MVFEKIKTKGDHEQVVFCNDRNTGLKAIIAIHSTALGPAIGGCRMYPYATEEAALLDVLNLSRAMSYKAASIGIDAGGGKSVIFGNPETDKTPELFRAFGQHIEYLKGRYIVAKDSGISTQDIQYISERTSNALGRPRSQGGIGDPSYHTALGVSYAMEAAVQFKLKKNSLKGLKILVQGAGSVGMGLIKILTEKGADILVSEIKESNLAEAKKLFPNIKEVNPLEIIETSCDIFSPCALGGVITESNLHKLKCSIIVGGANNQLSTSALALNLFKKGLCYVPDFVANSGGLIQVFSNWKKHPEEWIDKKIEDIREKIRNICQLSEEKGVATSEVAIAMAQECIDSKKSHFFYEAVPNGSFFTSPK